VRGSAATSLDRGGSVPQLQQLAAGLGLQLLQEIREKRTMRRGLQE